MSKRMLPNERPTSISYLDERFFIEIKMAAFLNFNKKQWRNRSSKFDNNGYKNGRFLIKFKKEKFLFKKLIKILRFVI